MKKFSGRQLIVGLVGVTLFYFIFSFFYHPTIISESKNEEATSVEQTSESQKAALPDESDFKQLESELTQVFDSETNDTESVSFHLTNQKGKNLFSHDPETTYLMAHTFHPLLAYVALHTLEEDPSYFQETGQTEAEIEEMIQTMIQDGDEETASVLASIVGYERILSDLHESGFESFGIDPAAGDQIRINSQDLAQFYADLNDGELLNINHTDYLLKQLQDAHEYFSAGYTVPGEVELIHQDGITESGHHHDGGVMMIGNEPYYYALLTYGEESEAIEKKELLHLIWSTMDNHLRKD